MLTEQSDVEAALADPEVYADGNKTTELLKKFSQLKESSEQALEKLGELEAELAELEAQRALNSGALKPVLPGWTPKALSVYGIYLSRDYQPSALPLFLDEIQQQLAQLS